MPFDGATWRDPSAEELEELMLLLCARALLSKRRRWWRGIASCSVWEVLTGFQRHCAVTALSAVAGGCGHPSGIRAQIRLMHHVPEQFGRAITVFNDHPSTSHADVLALYDRAIAELEDQP